eukprot:1675091-Heterocapsa_arctica.AAC.1
MAATPEDIRGWEFQAQDIADQERRRVAKARGHAFVKWTEEAMSTKAGKIFEWCKQEKPAPIVATKTVEGDWLIQANQVVGEATNRWSELWNGITFPRCHVLQ